MSARNTLCVTWARASRTVACSQPITARSCRLPPCERLRGVAPHSPRPHSAMPPPFAAVGCPGRAMTAMIGDGEERTPVSDRRMDARQRMDAKRLGLGRVCAKCQAHHCLSAPFHGRRRAHRQGAHLCLALARRGALFPETSARRTGGLERDAARGLHRWPDRLERQTGCSEDDAPRGSRGMGGSRGISWAGWGWPDKRAGLGSTCG